MDKLWLDIRYGIRRLVRQPVFTLVAVSTLALGIGANTAIFSLVDAALLRPLPYEDPGRLVQIRETGPHGEFNRVKTSLPNFLDWSSRNHVFTGLAGFNPVNYTLTRNGTDPERIAGTAVTAGFFELLGVQPWLGRSILPGEEFVDGERVALLSHGFWRRLGGDRGVLDTSIMLNGSPFKVIGVLPPEFHFALSGRSEVWVPLRATQARRNRRDRHWLQTIARLGPGTSLEAASGEMTALAQGMSREYPESIGQSEIRLVPIRDEIVGGVRPLLLIVLGGAISALLVTCVNLANLSLARGSTRGREMAVRSALGASRQRLMRQLLVESLLLALTGGAAALVVAEWGASFLVGLIPAGLASRLPHLMDLHLDARLLGVALFVTLLAGLVSGLAPALDATRGSLARWLKDGGRTETGAAGRLGDVLVVCEIAMATVLLISAGLVLQSLQRLLNIEEGFRVENVVAMNLSLPPSRYSGAAQVAGFYENLRNRAAGLPGVQKVGVIDEIPLTGDRETVRLLPAGSRRWTPERGREAALRSASPGYFETLSIPLLAGRLFTTQDDTRRPPVALLSRALADQLSPFGDPVGLHLEISPSGPELEVVGVVGDVKLAGLPQAARPAIYLCNLQNPSRSSVLVLKTPSRLAGVASQVRELVHGIDSALPVYGVQAMEQVRDETPGVFMRRSATSLLGCFAFLGLTLAVVGLYGLMNCWVARRIREIGIRMALGAKRGVILRRVVGRGLAAAFLGVATGCVLAIGVTRLLGSLLFGIGALDLTTFAVGAILITAIATAACYLPARRAASVDPLIALRQD